jgi:hypothetical protein
MDTPSLDECILIWPEQTREKLSIELKKYGR